MTDYAERIVIPRPRTRTIDRLIDLINSAIPYIIAVLVGAALGIGQGYMQADNHWTKKIIERSHVDAYGQALPIYEDNDTAYYATPNNKTIK